MLMLFITTSSIAIAQIQVKSKNDTLITLPKPILKHAIIDIEKGDYYNKEWQISLSNIDLLNQKLSLKDSVITQYKQKDLIFYNIIKNDSLYSGQQNIIIKDLTSQVKKAKIKTGIVEVVSGAIIAGLIYLELK